MKIIECITGATEQNVGGSTYKFKPDDYGRYTVKIFHVAHQRMFLSRPAIYREVPEHPLKVSEKSARTIRPKGGEPDQKTGNQTGAGESKSQTDDEATLNAKAAADKAEADKIAAEAKAQEAAKAKEAADKAEADKAAADAKAKEDADNAKAAADTDNTDTTLTPQQRAAQTRAANKAAKEKEAADAAQKEQV